MRLERTGGRGAVLSTVAVCVLVAGLALAGCSGADSGGADSKEASASPIVDVASSAAPASLSPSPSPSPSPYKDNDDVFLAMGDCYGPATFALEPGQVQEMACDDPAALGKVRYRSKTSLSLYGSPYCPADADGVLGIAARTGNEADRAGSSDILRYATAPRYVCVRYLKGPHPGDPGGGGMEIRVGDCLSGTGTYREVACDGGGATYKIVKQTLKGQSCPRKNDILVSTDTLLDQAGLSSLAYCARPI
ncbi:hypothetical protein [Actinoplanes sp. ATCC 53533]|uniref:hypothetical protein n=1 Tax=Actinoplanes sp. ATCC 53533 TaxID=1288362 RepID=UPI000F798773|nr:hypothetical protein [Actinoplanes sp. ATCC 53533]